nr:MAG TPA: hypothetical protein [Caudoviricetes sp.]DAQ79294.1 MAG TPA: hypothetical protein [Caudoviricetes sp.]
MSSSIFLYHFSMSSSPFSSLCAFLKHKCSIAFGYSEVKKFFS